MVFRVASLQLPKGDLVSNQDHVDQWILEFGEMDAKRRSTSLPLEGVCLKSFVSLFGLLIRETDISNFDKDSTTCTYSKPSDAKRMYPMGRNRRCKRFSSVLSRKE